DVHLGADRRERGPEGLAEGPGPGPQVGLVHQVGGGAVLGRERVDPQPAHVDDAAHAARRGGPGRARHRGAAGGRRHILSGADTPSRSSPLARTWRVASFSHSRVRCTSETSSSPKGVTRRWSYHLWYAPAISSRWRATRC